MGKIISLNCTMGYFLSSTMGAVLHLEEGEPEEVHLGLIWMINQTFEKVSDSTFIADFQPGIQVNSRDFYFREDGMWDLIIDLYQKNQTALNIHQANDAQPLPEYSQFYKETQTNLDFSKRLGAHNLVIHLPVRKQDDTENVISCLSNISFLETLKSYNISLDFENNHHNSFFGNLDNCSNLLNLLDDRLDSLGFGDIKHQFGFTFDSGHYITQSHLMHYPQKKMLHRFFETQHQRINTLHLHKNDGIRKDQHILLGLAPDNNIIATKTVDPVLVQKYETLILDALPILKWKSKNNSNLVLEIDHPYSSDDLANCLSLIGKYL